MKNQAVCRVCLEKGELKSIFSTNCLSHVQMSCAEVISKISTVVINEDDDFPKTICKKCLTKLKAAYKFKILCEDSNLKLIQQSRTLNDCVNKKELDDKTKFDDCVINQLSSDRVIDLDDTNFQDCLENQNGDNEDNRETLLNVTESLKLVVTGTIKTDSKIKFNAECIDGKSSNRHVCNKKFKNKKRLKEYVVTNEENETYFCNICKKNFSSEYSHKLSHKNDKQFQCEICAKVFLRSATLRMHQLAHKNVLPFRCTHPGCDKAFPLNSRLKLHQKVHTNERNFICQYCSHAARDKQQLTVHIRYFHTKEKNFLCGTCGKGFVSPQARYYHAKRHENIRNHHCPHCDKSFVFAFGLQDHLITHTGEKRFSCSLCDTRFSRKAHKINHEMRIHGIKKPPSQRMPRRISQDTMNDQ